MEAQTITTEASTDIEVIKKMEDDHLHLQRQVRLVQVDRLHRTMGVHPQFRRQDNLLRTLKEEYEDLALDLKIARSGAHKKKDKKMKNGLKRSLLFREETQVNCEGGVAIMDEFDGLLQRNNKEMIGLRQRAAACQGEIETRRFQSEKRLASAENQLETAMLRFNAIRYENKKIREEIEHMLNDRLLFNQAWDKMLTALGKGKKFLSDLFESSTLAYGQRDEWVAKLRSIQEKGKMDQMLQVQEMRDLKKCYDHEMKVYLFLAKKGVMRINPRELERIEAQKKKNEKEMEEEIDKHFNILDEIKEYTQETNYFKIIDSFLKKEQENFSIYKLIADYCAENQVLTRDLQRTRQEIDNRQNEKEMEEEIDKHFNILDEYKKDRRDWNEVKEIEEQNKLETLHQQLEEQSRRTSALRAQYEQQDRLLKDTMEKVQDIFKMLDCSLEPFQNLLGDKQPSLHQLNLTMCLITDKIKEHIETVYYFERVLKRSEERHEKSSYTSRLKKFMIRVEPRNSFQLNSISDLVPVNPCPSCIETRWISRICEAPEKPFNKNQAIAALNALASDPAYIRSDRVHALADCRATASRKLLATRHVKY